MNYFCIFKRTWQFILVALLTFLSILCSYVSPGFDVIYHIFLLHTNTCFILGECKNHPFVSIPIKLIGIINKSVDRIFPHLLRFIYTQTRKTNNTSTVNQLVDQRFNKEVPPISLLDLFLSF